MRAQIFLIPESHEPGREPTAAEVGDGATGTSPVTADLDSTMLAGPRLPSRLPLGPVPEGMRSPSAASKSAGGAL